MAIAPTRDEQIEQMFKVILQKKEEIQKVERPTWKTNGSFSFDKEGNGTRFNIQTVSNVQDLIYMLGHILKEKDAFVNACAALNISDKNTTSFYWQNKPVKDWLDDFKTRINKIQLTQRKLELEKLEAELNKMVSPEKRDEIKFEMLRANFEAII